MREILDTTYALLVEEHAGAFVSRSDSRKAVDSWLNSTETAEAEAVTPSAPARVNTLDPPTPEEIDPETWGLSPRAIAEQEAFMQTAGGSRPA